ncbi:hypothetical protein PEDI_48890 [Persicobacter diffluens]|uniref:Uncharacterized protein n=1 Tax=Persicobacter diffluens TaxID=981 RepID=A0AAN4W4W7_9BACT|nr:hypothetical protein PEDI_48890 [Persicobacter diffluens]
MDSMLYPYSFGPMEKFKTMRKVSILHAYR